MFWLLFTCLFDKNSVLYMNKQQKENTMKKYITFIITLNILLWFGLGSIANSANKTTNISKGYNNDLVEFHLWLKKNNHTKYLTENGDIALDVKPYKGRWAVSYTHLTLPTNREV